MTEIRVQEKKPVLGIPPESLWIRERVKTLAEKIVELLDNYEDERAFEYWAEGFRLAAQIKEVDSQ